MERERLGERCPTRLVGVKVERSSGNVEDDGRRQSGEDRSLVRVVRIQARLDDVVPVGGGGTNLKNRPRLVSGSGPHSRVWKCRLTRRTDLRKREEGVRAVYAEDVRAASVVRTLGFSLAARASRKRKVSEAHQVVTTALRVLGGRSDVLLPCLCEPLTGTHEPCEPSREEQASQSRRLMPRWRLGACRHLLRARETCGTSDCYT